MKKTIASKARQAIEFLLSVPFLLAIEIAILLNPKIFNDDEP